MDRNIRRKVVLGADILSTQHFSCTTASPPAQTGAARKKSPFSRCRREPDAPDHLYAWINRMIRRVNRKGKSNTLGKWFGCRHTVSPPFALIYSSSRRLNGPGGFECTIGPVAAEGRRTRSTKGVVQPREQTCGSKWIEIYD
jgi:hypothetical protein